MNMVEMKCPYCGADLHVDNGLDSFFCMHCGGKILLEGQDKNVIDAKVKLKQMETDADLEKFKLQMEADERERQYQRDVADRKKVLKIVFFCLFGAPAIIFFLMYIILISL